MITQSSYEGYIMPQTLRTVLTADPTRDQWASFTAAMAFARSGFRVLPCVTGGKAPLVAKGFRHGARSATSDPEMVRDTFVAHPGANVGIAIDRRFVVLDVDPRNGGSLEAAAAFGLPIDGYRERSGGDGWHIPLTLPRGFQAGRSAVLGPGVEIKAAGTYVVSPHSRLDGAARYRPDPDRDVWAWGKIDQHWSHLDRLTQRERALPALGTITAAHRRAAERVITGLMHAPGDIAQAAKMLLAGIVPPDDSPSEGDYRLALLASFHNDCPEVIAAVLEASRRSRPKWLDHDSYLAATIAKVRARRKELARDAVAHHDARTSIQRLIDAGQHAAPGVVPELTTPNCELMLQFGLQGCRNRAASPVLAFLLGVRASGPDSPYRREGGWTRVPVLDLAQVLDLDRATVWRALERLESAGVLERDTVCARVHGRPRRDSLARFVGGLEELA